MKTLYQCAACGAEHERDDVIAAAGPRGAFWYCRDAEECRARTAEATS